MKQTLNALEQLNKGETMAIAVKNLKVGKQSCNICNNAD